MPPVGSIRLQCFIHRKNVKVHCGTIKTNFISICTLACRYSSQWNFFIYQIRILLVSWLDWQHHNIPTWWLWMCCRYLQYVWRNVCCRGRSFYNNVLQKSFLCNLWFSWCFYIMFGSIYKPLFFIYLISAVHRFTRIRYSIMCWVESF